MKLTDLDLSQPGMLLVHRERAWEYEAALASLPHIHVKGVDFEDKGRWAWVPDKPSPVPLPPSTAREMIVHRVLQLYAPWKRHWPF